MKKILNFLRSMRFGIILLLLIALCSLLGSVLPQERAISWYAQNYPSLHGAILLLKLNSIFESWYFALLLALLCLNLTLCSLVRIVSVVRDRERLAERASRLTNSVRLSPEGLERLREHLVAIRCEAVPFGEATVYRKNALGRYGSFLLHLSILLTVLFGAAALYLPEVTDQTCMPGQALVMEDGTQIYVESFYIENPSGQLDFTSQLHITLPNGRQSPLETIRVNYPMSFGPYKVYQQTYGTAGSVTVTNLETGGTDDFTLTEMVFLSIDSVNGMWYEALYPSYIRDPSGNVTLVTSTTGRYTDPVYQVLLASDGEYTPVLAFPGDSVQVGGMEFKFNDPVEYPGLRIKRTPTLVNALLIASFVIMLAGLYITFFMQPVLVKADAEGYAVGGPKPEGIRLELEELLKPYEQEEKE